MTRPQYPEPDVLRRACTTVLEQMETQVWLSPEGQPLTDLAAALKAYYLQTRRMFRLSRSLENCRQALQACERMDRDVRQSVISSLDLVEGLPGPKLEQVLPLLDAAAAAGDSVNKLTNESPLRVRVGSNRALEDSCLKLLEFLSEPQMQAAPEPAPTPVPVEEPAPAEVVSAPVEIKHGSRTDITPVARPDSKDGTGFGVQTAADGKPIPRLSVAKLREFLEGGSLPAGAAALAPWLERNPDETLPNSWVIPAGCPVTGSDVLVAFGRSRKEVIFSKAGQMLRFNQEGVLIPS